MQTVREIKKRLIRYKETLKQRYGVKELGVFGSFVRNEQTKTSDVDMLITFNKGAKVSLLDFVHIENYLSDKLGLKVDLVEKSTLKPVIGKHILKEVHYI